MKKDIVIFVLASVLVGLLPAYTLRIYRLGYQDSVVNNYACTTVQGYCNIYKHDRTSTVEDYKDPKVGEMGSTVKSFIDIISNKAFW